MSYAARERATRSRQHLSRRFGPLLARWAAERGMTWDIDESWSVDILLEFIEMRRASYHWGRLKGPSRPIATVDARVRWFANFSPPRQRPENSEEARRFTVDELHERMRATRPDIPRATVRSILFAEKRRGNIRRVGRGIYEEIPDDPFFDWRPRHASEGKWELRAQLRRQREIDVFLVHYLLPHLPAYRKAKALELSDRLYFYVLNEALDWLRPHLESLWENVQS